MNRRFGLIFVVFSAITAILLANSFYTVMEGRQAIITQFGKPVGDPVYESGLHIKIPFIQKVTFFEKRVLEWDGYPNQIPTKDKRYIWVDTTARWRIENPLKFYRSVYNEQGAQSRLDDIIDSAVRDAVTSHNLIEIVRSSNRLIEEAKISQQDKEFVQEGALEPIKFGRDSLHKIIVQSAQQLAPQYGIEIVDVRIKRVNYVEEVQLKVYERMTTERKRAAEEYRSEGRGIRAEIEGRTEKELKGILSEAYKKAQEIKGLADAKATEIYAAAYNKDPGFYALLKTLETYQKTIDKDTTVILSTDGDYFKFMKSSTPE
ncbi:MAG: protease modulator HflC [Candidatus Auribacterota bacterium]